MRWAAQSQSRNDTCKPRSTAASLAELQELEIIAKTRARESS